MRGGHTFPGTALEINGFTREKIVGGKKRLWDFVAARLSETPTGQETEGNETLKEVFSELESADDRSGLGVMAEYLIAFAENHGDEVAANLPDYALKLVLNGRPGAAAALEACGRLGLSKSAPAFEAALKRSSGVSGSLVQQVAAQRVRLLSIDEPDKRRDLGRLVRRWVDCWLRLAAEVPDPQRHTMLTAARDAIGSVAVMQGASCLKWLVKLIRESDYAEIVEASAHAVCILALKNEVPRTAVEFAKNASMLLAAIESRLKSGNFEGTIATKAFARARLIEVAGVSGRWAPQEQVARLLARWLPGASVTDRAALLRAARHLIGGTSGSGADELEAALRKESGSQAVADFLRMALQGANDRSATQR
jgi:hypothetical protein